MRSLLYLWLCFLIASPAAAQQKQSVDVELVLLADASRSIDDEEIRLQRQGYAWALTHKDVLDAILYGFEGRIAVTYVEWGDENWQDVVVPWQVIANKKDAENFAALLLAAPRRATGPNAIGSAIAAGHALIEGNGYQGTRRIIDFSADSAYTFGGIPPELAREAALSDGVIINGLAVLCRAKDCSGRPVGYDLEKAFADFIIGGPGSFCRHRRRSRQLRQGGAQKTHPGNRLALTSDFSTPQVGRAWRGFGLTRPRRGY